MSTTPEMLPPIPYDVPSDAVSQRSPLDDLDEMLDSGTPRRASTEESQPWQAYSPAEPRRAETSADTDIHDEPLNREHDPLGAKATKLGKRAFEALMYYRTEATTPLERAAISTVDDDIAANRRIAHDSEIGGGNDAYFAAYRARRQDMDKRIANGKPKEISRQEIRAEKRAEKKKIRKEERAANKRDDFFDVLKKMFEARYPAATPEQWSSAESLLARRGKRLLRNLGYTARSATTSFFSRIR